MDPEAIEGRQALELAGPAFCSDSLLCYVPWGVKWENKSAHMGVSETQVSKL